MHCMVLMEYRQEFEQGTTFPDFLETAGSTPELWRAIYERVEVPVELAERARAHADAARLLVLSEDWCGDAVNSVPFVARLAEEAGVDLRIIERDRYPHVMDAHLSRGARSIPVVIVLDQHFRELAWWGPRPRELQQWFVEAGKTLPPGERYRELRRRYARDRGITIMTEIVEMIENPAEVRRHVA